MDFEFDGHLQDILLKCLTGHANEQEYKEAYDWIHLNDENGKYFNNLFSAWFAGKLVQKHDKKLEQKLWKKISFEKQKSHRLGMIFKNRILKIASVLAITYTLGILSHSILTKRPTGLAQYTVTTPKGTKTEINLIDGTHVWINAGSKIEYPANYSANNRDLYLSGEAYFEVAKNKPGIFRVHAGGIVVTALGTTFNVKAYPEEKVVETTLLEGLVSIEKTGDKVDQQAFLLKPAQHAVYYKTLDQIALGDSSSVIKDRIAKEGQNAHIGKVGQIVLSPRVEPEVYTSWKDKRWVFHNELFGEFLLKIERIYDIHIVVENPELSDYKLTGSIEEENIELVLKALQLIVPIDYRFENKQLYIRTNENLKKKYDKMLRKNTN
jgi:transmembrane sensor